MKGSARLVNPFFLKDRAANDPIPLLVVYVALFLLFATMAKTKKKDRYRHTAGQARPLSFARVKNRCYIRRNSCNDKRPAKRALTEETRHVPTINSRSEFCIFVRNRHFHGATAAGRMER
jgi:hypothetical protein